jgi:RNA polymerase sigma-70 factor (ECF subfamily)
LPSDERLVQLAQRDPGSQASRSAAADLLERYQDAVYAWCRRYTNDRDSALDLAQDVLLTAYQKLPALADSTRLGSWLFTITRNLCLNAVTRRRETVELDAERLLDGRESSQADQVVLARDEENKLLDALRGVLDETEQDVVWMKYVDGFSIVEIERTLKLGTKSGARTILQRARKKLRRAYGRGEAPGKGFSS